MADSEPGPSGRGGGSGRGPSRKFAPTVPGRRKRAEELHGTAASAAEAAAASEAFQELLKAAQSEAKWERGRGRGRGRGPARAQVAFGGSVNDRPMGLARTSRGPAAAKLKEEPGPSSYAAVGHAHDAGGHEGMNEMQMVKKEKTRQAMLDYSTYYPTMLPMRPPHLESELEGKQQQQQQAPVPTDLAIVPDAPDNPAATLGLQQGASPQHMFLMQMPATLPLARMHQEDGPAAAAGPGSRRGPSAGAAAAPAGAGAAVKDLPSGRLGRLLVFESGKVKLQVGEVLLDVHSGVPLQTRQDVAALNLRGGHCVLLGDLAARMVLCPDVLQLIDDVPVPEFQRSMHANGRLAGKGRAAAHEGAPDSDEEMVDEDSIADSIAGKLAAKAGAKAGKDTLPAKAKSIGKAEESQEDESEEGEEDEEEDEDEEEQEEEKQQQQQQQQLGRLRRKPQQQVQPYDGDEEMEDA